MLIEKVEQAVVSQKYYFINFSGVENMAAFQLRKGAKSKRIYCKECFSILAVDHPGYNDERFSFSKIIVLQH